MTEDKDYLDWDELSAADQNRAEELLKDLNEIFNKYSKKEDESCEPSTSID